MHLQEDEILTLLQVDPERSLSMMYDEYFKYLVGVTYRILKDEDSTHDIIQAVFIDIWQKKEIIEIKSSLKQYLRRAAINKALNKLRSNKKLVEDNDGIENLNFSNEHDHSLNIEAKELNVEIEEAINELPERCRMVFVLSRYEGMTYKQIAEKLEISQKTVENQMIKALKIMRSKIFKKNE